MNAQEIFDTVVTHLRGMPHRSMDGVKRAYRGNGGLKCAVGVIIRDEEYSSDMEGWDVFDLYYHGMLPERLIPHVRLLLDLQELHDSYSCWGRDGLNSEGERRLAGTATWFGLTYTPPGAQ